MQCVTAIRAALVGLGLAGAALAGAQTAPLQTQDTNTAGVVAELTECRRSEGVLSIKVRLRNTGEASATVPLIHGHNYDAYYVVAAGKKYFVLRDSEKTPLAVAPTSYDGSVSAGLKKGGIFLWWAKYPAPPPDVKKVTYVMPLGAPFENVPVSDQ
jgi:hypothetical protein